MELFGVGDKHSRIQGQLRPAMKLCAFFYLLITAYTAFNRVLAIAIPMLLFAIPMAVFMVVVMTADADPEAFLKHDLLSLSFFSRFLSLWPQLARSSAANGAKGDMHKMD